MWQWQYIQTLWRKKIVDQHDTHISQNNGRLVQMQHVLEQKEDTVGYQESRPGWIAFIFIRYL